MTPASEIDELIAKLGSGESTLAITSLGPSVTRDFVCTGADLLRILEAQPFVGPDDLYEGIAFGGRVVDDFVVPEGTVLRHCALVIGGDVDGDVIIDGQIGDVAFHDYPMGLSITGEVGGSVVCNGTVIGELSTFEVAGDIVIAGSLLKGFYTGREVQGDVRVLETATLRGCLVRQRLGGNIHISGTAEKVEVSELVEGVCVIDGTVSDGLHLNHSSLVRELVITEGATLGRVYLHGAEGQIERAEIAGAIDGLNVASVAGTVHVTASAHIDMLRMQVPLGNKLRIDPAATVREVQIRNPDESSKQVWLDAGKDYLHE